MVEIPFIFCAEVGALFSFNVVSHIREQPRKLVNTMCDIMVQNTLVLT